MPRSRSKGQRLRGYERSSGLIGDKCRMIRYDSGYRPTPRRGSTSRIFKIGGVFADASASTYCQSSVDGFARYLGNDEAGNVIETHEQAGEFKEW